MSLTRPQIRLKLYLRGWGLGFARTGTAIVAQGITDAVAFQDSGDAEGNKVGTFIYRPLAAAADQTRAGNVIVIDTLTHTGKAYSDPAGPIKGYEVTGMHPDEFNDCIRRAQRRIYAETWSPQSVWTDGDLSGTIASPYDWVANATGTTATKSPTTGNGKVGYNSLVLTGAGSVQTSIFSVQPGDRFVHGAANRASASGTSALYSLLDITHGSVIGAAWSNLGLGFQHFYRTDTIPAGCYAIAAKLETVGAGVTYWDYTVSHLAGREGGQIDTVPSWLTDKARLLGFGPAKYGRTVALNQYNASARRFLDWNDPLDFELFPRPEESTPYLLQVNRESGLEERDFWYHGLRPYSDITDLTDETSTTNAPEDLLMAAVTCEVAKTRMTQTKDPSWKVRYDAAELELSAQRWSRRVSAPRFDPEVHVVGGRAGMGYETPSEFRF